MLDQALHHERHGRGIIVHIDHPEHGRFFDFEIGFCFCFWFGVRHDISYEQ